MAIKFEWYNEQERLLRAYSNNNKYLNEYDKNGNITLDREGKVVEYVEAVNYGTCIDEDNGIFDNGKFYIESEKDIPIIEPSEDVSQETNEEI